LQGGLPEVSGVATLNRANVDPKLRRPFYVLVDEFQKFTANEDLPKFFAESRKFAAHMVVAHQYRSQITDRKVADGVLSAGAIVGYQMLDKDAAEIGRQIGSKAAAYLPTLDRFECYVKLPGEQAHLMGASRYPKP